MADRTRAVLDHERLAQLLGHLDTITPMENATRTAAEAGGPVETLIWEDSGHCCHDRSHIVRPAMADFMCRWL